jgi:WD40 repeat protein
MAMQKSDRPTIWLCISFATFLAAGGLSGLTVLTRPKGSVRSELSRQQAQTGLTFAWIHDGVKVVSFKKRSVIPVEGLLNAFRPDGFSFQEYPQVTAMDMCWSHDQSKLAATMLDNPPFVSVEILDLKSKQARVIAPHLEQTWHVTSQCWSPDDKQIVYETEATVLVYDLESGKTRVLATGIDPRVSLNPTWSPDGKRIAFLDHDTYYSIQPSGGTKKKLFAKKGACSGLYWSPDSSIAAYVGEASILEEGLTYDGEINRVRVKRLQDGSEGWIARDVDCIANYRWITDKDFISQRKPASK